MKNKDGGSSWGLGSEEGLGLAFCHTPISNYFFGKPKK
jgi:hypothetical protein